MKKTVYGISVGSQQRHFFSQCLVTDIFSRLSCMSAFITLSYGMVFPLRHKFLYGTTQKTLKKLVSSAWHIVRHVCEQAQQGDGSNDALQALVLEHARFLRYGPEVKAYCGFMMCTQ